MLCGKAPAAPCYVANTKSKHSLSRDQVVTDHYMHIAQSREYIQAALSLTI